jgi:hypothetical protein
MNKQTVQIIDGRRYNTATATEIASYWNGLSLSDFHTLTETLYRTPKGAFFLVGSGGALTSYSKSCGNNSYCGGTRWTVLSDEDAFKWLQDNEYTEQLETLFADKIQDA